MTDLIAIQKIAGWEKLKTLVLDSVSSPITKRVYNMALDEFLAWFQQAPRHGFTKATLLALGGYRWRTVASGRGQGRNRTADASLFRVALSRSYLIDSVCLASHSCSRFRLFIGMKWNEIGRNFSSPIHHHPPL